MTRLNRKSYFATVYGDSKAKYYQDGTYFDGAGHEISTAQAARALPQGAAVQAALDAEAAKESPDATAIPEIPEVPTVDAATTADELGGLHVAKIKSMFKDREGPEDLMSGTGAKERMIEWLVANAAG